VHCKFNVVSSLKRKGKGEGEGDRVVRKGDSRTQDVERTVKNEEYRRGDRRTKEGKNRAISV
jgi:hypothetical protein